MIIASTESPISEICYNYVCYSDWQKGARQVLKWLGILFMLVAIGLMASVLPYAEDISEFFSLPGIRRFFILFAVGAIVYLFGRYRINK
jgi:hypothetical protein